ncbi:MAG: M4 family metallopeptidase, partial [Acidiferrobacterales bacterium]
MMNKATFCFIFLFPFIVACNTSDSPSTTPDEGGGVGLVVINDGDAETLLGKARAEKLEKLKRAFNTSVELTLNRRTNAIKSIGFVYDKDATSVADLKTHAESFVANYLDLIDPNINVGELIVTPERQCYSNLKDFGSIRFDRVIGGTAVLGSHLTLHYGEKGLLVKVENSLASISRSTLQKDKAKVSLKDGISKMMGQRKVKVVGTQKITPVIMPVMSQGETRLVGGELVVWSTGAGGANDNDGVMAGVVLTSGEVVGPWDTGVDNYNTGGIGDVHLDERTELPDFITFRSKGGIAVNSAGVLDDPAEIVYRFLEQYPSVFRSGDTRCQFRLKGAKTLAELEKVTYVKMQQTIAGYRVFGGELVFEVEDGNVIMSAQGHILPEASMPLSAKINAGSALEEAKQQLRKQANFIAEDRREAFIEQADKANWRGTELLIFPGQLHTGKPTDSRLAFKVQLDNYVIFIDAINSELLYAYNIRSNANVVVEGGGLTENFSDRPNYVTVNVDGAPVGVPAAGNTDIPFTIADVGTSAAFFAAHGWTGLNGRGSDFTAITNLVLGLGCPNAFFEPYISDNAFFCLGMGQNDVVPHEFTHGVTAYSSALIYLDESGALNESYSDIMSNLAFPDLIPAGSPPGTLPGWIVGETGGFGGCAGAFRNMAAPGACGDPGNWSGYLSRTDLGCAPADIFGTGPGCDSGGVHSNSG